MLCLNPLTSINHRCAVTFVLCCSGSCRYTGNRVQLKQTLSFPNSLNALVLCQRCFLLDRFFFVEYDSFDTAIFTPSLTLILIVNGLLAFSLNVRFFLTWWCYSVIIDYFNNLLINLYPFRLLFFWSLGIPQQWYLVFAVRSSIGVLLIDDFSCSIWYLIYLSRSVTGPLKDIALIITSVIMFNTPVTSLQVRFLLRTTYHASYWVWCITYCQHAQVSVH